MTVRYSPCQHWPGTEGVDLTPLCWSQVKPKRIRSAVEQRPLTQDELLAEAARTELDNLRDLEQMVALEEATRKKAMYKRSKYSGPMIRFHSKKVDDVGLVSDSLQLLLAPGIYG